MFYDPAMKRDFRLLFGPLGAVLLTLGILGVAILVPGYSHIRQTVSEIGEVDSSGRIPFTIMLCSVAACLIIFAAGVRAECLKAGHGTASAYLIGFMAVSAAGVGIFAFPDPWHNLFGESELIGYQAPLALALNWRGDPRARNLVRFSWIMFALVWISIGLNMSSLDRHTVLWAELKPIYGLIQRSLFAAWFCWAAGVGVMLFRAAPRARG